MKPAIFLLLLFAACVDEHREPVETNPIPFLSVAGNAVVDESGERVVLRGVSFSDPDRLEKAGQWNRAYFEVAKDWGANLVRFPVHPRAWRERGEEAYLRLVDEGVQWAGELGMYVIIDWHSIGNLVTEKYQHEMYNTTKAETARFWELVAARYAGDPVVAFYELFNEPTVGGSGEYGPMSWRQHKELMEGLISAARAHDDRKIFLVAGFDWAYELRSVIGDPVGFPNVAYVSHPYPQKRPQPWESKWEADWGHVAGTYPVFVTEFGFMAADGPGAHVPVIGDETYGEAIVGYMQQKGISWTAWVFDPEWSPQLFRTWQFEPTMQGEFLRTKMRELNGAGR